jgi:Predicted transcriptional regulators
MDYIKISKQVKVISDPNRMKIIDMLSCGTMCACDILDNFDFTQPSLSHHMKVLEDAMIVSVEKKGKWHYYTLRDDFVKEFMANMEQLFSKNEDCICHEKKCNNC